MKKFTLENFVHFIDTFRNTEFAKEYAMVYQELWEIADIYVFEHFDGDDLEYFVDTTD